MHLYDIVVYNQNWDSYPLPLTLTLLHLQHYGEIVNNKPTSEQSPTPQLRCKMTSPEGIVQDSQLNVERNGPRYPVNKGQRPRLFDVLKKII